MGFTRRGFLQQLGMVLAACGVSEAGLWLMGDRYRQVLAAPTSRKLALLVGINQYPGGTTLEGCVTDVELQRELLIHRFGFHSNDILTLTDQQATRTAVEQAFTDHLIQQAQPEDVVVFHFSGFGSTLRSNGLSEIAQSSLVLADAPRSDGETPIVGDMLQDTLWLLLRSLKTDKVTTVLDTSYTYPGQALAGNLRIRSYQNPSLAQPTAAELDYHTQLLNRLNQTRELSTLQPVSQLPGVMLAAAGDEQLAAEAHWSRFSAGLFTHALTQTLWQTTPAQSVQISLGQVAEHVRPLVNQHPQLGGRRVQEPSLSPYFLPPPAVSADGAVIAADESGKSVQLWLGGLPAQLLEQYGVHSLFQLLPGGGDSTSAEALSSSVQLQVMSRDGLVARATVYDPASLDKGENSQPIQVGQWVQEVRRVVPRDVGLTVALDNRLERIERVDAVSAFSALPRISSAIAGEQPADYLFSKAPTRPTQVAALPTASLSVQSSYGLFSPGQNIILNTIGEGGEAVKVAVRRLLPKLQTLLATKLLSLTINEQTSRLPVRATLEMLAPQERLLLKQETTRGMPAPPRPPQARVVTDDLLQVPMGSRIRYRLENISAQPLYVLLLVLDGASNLVSLHTPTIPPAQQTDDEPHPNLGAIAPDTSLILPIASAGANWTLQGPAGLAEAYMICSTAPFTHSLTALATGQQSSNGTSTVIPISNPLDVAHAVLEDLHRASEVSSSAPGVDAFVLDVNTWATLHFVYQVG